MNATSGNRPNLRIPMGEWPLWARIVTAFFGSILPLAGLIIVSGAVPTASSPVRTTAEKLGFLILAVIITLILARPISARLIGKRPVTGKNWLLWALGGTIFLNVVVSAYQLIAPPKSTMAKQLSTMGFENVNDGIVLALMICAVGPLAEEIVYRTMFQRGVRDAALKWFSPKIAIIISILASGWLFQSLHGDENQINQAPVYIFFGVLTALAYEKTGNLLIPVAMHALNNSYVVLMGLTVNRIGEPVSPLVVITILICPIIAIAGSLAIRAIYDAAGGDPKKRQPVA